MLSRAWAIAPLVAAGLAFAAPSQAATKHHALKCRAGYVRHTVRAPVRKHGRIVRKRGKIVYRRVQRCVTVTKPKPKPKPTTTTPTAPTPRPPVVPPPSTPTTPSPPPPPPPPPRPKPPGKYRAARDQRYDQAGRHAKRLARDVDQQSDELRLPVAGLLEQWVHEHSERNQLDVHAAVKRRVPLRRRHRHGA